MALTQVSTGGVKDGSLLNADINASAAIAGSKLNPVGLSNVGIGTTSPSEKLHTANAGNINTKIECTASGSGANAGLNLKSADGGDYFIQTGNAVSGGLRVYDAGASAERMRVLSDGRLLIGTTTGAAFSNRQLSVASSSGTTSIELRSATDGDSRILFTDSTSSSDSGAYKGQIMYDQTNDFMSFNTNGNNERFRINQSGGVGIGLTDIAGFGGSYKGIDVGSKGSGLAGRTDNVTIDLRSNTFYDGSNHKYGGTSTTAGQLSVGGAQLTFSNAPTGTAGATATLTQRLNIGNNGAIYASSGDTSNASQTLRKTVTNADSIDYLQCRSSNNSLMAKIGGNGGISNFQSNDANLSDETMKKNIVDCESIIEKFKQWKLKKFNYNFEADGTPLTYGVIAQEVESIHSDLVNADFPVDESGKEVMKKTVKDHQLMMLGFKALQEAIAKIEVLETKVAALETG